MQVHIVQCKVFCLLSIGFYNTVLPRSWRNENLISSNFAVRQTNKGKTNLSYHEVEEIRHQAFSLEPMEHSNKYFCCWLNDVIDWLLVHFFFFFEIHSRRWNHSLRTDWDCMASLKCRTPCRKTQTWLPTKTPPRKTRPKTWVKANEFNPLTPRMS